jgi:phosphatidylinositol alpha-1,6-mannosyltransferase
LPTRARYKILCLTSNFPRWEGDWTTPFVLHLARDLQQMGWQVDVLAPHAPGCAKREMFQGVAVERFQYIWPSNQQSVCYEGGALINLRKKKSNYVKLPAFVLAQLTALLRKLAAGRYDLVHSHWLLPQGFVGSLGICLARLPHVVTIHGGDIFGLRQKIFLPFKRFALKRAHAVTVNSSATERAVKAIVPDINTLHRIPMGIEISDLSRQEDQVRAIQRRYRSGNGPLIVFAGRIVEEKGLEDLIRAMPLILEQCPEACTLVVGEGQDRASMKTLSKKIGLGDCVFFTGWIDPELVPVYLAAADVFAGPSRQAVDGWIEAQGLAFLEAMAVGTPVVATRSGGIVDSVVHEKTGLLVEERSPEQVAAAIIRLNMDQELAKKLKKQGRKFVEDAYSRKACATRFSELFESLISDKRVSS